MKLIADTNILFSFFLETSFTKRFLLSTKIMVVSSEKAIEEIIKYSKLIMQKSRISKKEFDKKLNQLRKIVKFENKKEYSYYLKQAEEISPDKDDSHFLALGLKYNCFLWSNDKVLKNQQLVKVFSTKELIELLF